MVYLRDVVSKKYVDCKLYNSVIVIKIIGTIRPRIRIGMSTELVKNLISKYQESNVFIVTNLVHREIIFTFAY